MQFVMGQLFFFCCSNEILCVFLSELFLSHLNLFPSLISTPFLFRLFFTAARLIVRHQWPSQDLSIRRALGLGFLLYFAMKLVV